jgi:hypothetical protein
VKTYERFAAIESAIVSAIIKVAESAESTSDPQKLRAAVEAYGQLRNIRKPFEVQCRKDAGLRVDLESMVVDGALTPKQVDEIVRAALEKHYGVTPAPRHVEMVEPLTDQEDIDRRVAHSVLVDWLGHTFGKDRDMHGLVYETMCELQAAARKAYPALAHDASMKSVAPETHNLTGMTRHEQKAYSALPPEQQDRRC